MADIDVGFYPKAPDPNALFTMASNVVGLDNAAQQNRLLQTQNQQSQQDLRLQQLGVLRSALGAVAADPNASYNSFSGLKTLVDQGLVSPDFYQAEMAKVPQQASPDVYRQIANGYNAQLATVAERYAMENGIQLGTANMPTSYTNEVGANVPTTYRQYPADIGLGNGQGGGGGVANPFLATGGGASPGVGGNQLMGAPDLPMAPPAAGADTGRVAAPSPQQQKMFEASASQFQADKEAAANWQQAKVPLEKMIQLLPTTNTGKGIDLLTLVPDVANMLGIPIGADQSQQLAELKKYAANMARASGAAGNSDNQLAAAFAGNPNTDMNNAAAQDVSKTLLSLARMSQAKTAAAIASGVAPEQYSDFAQQWGATQDPLAYGFDLLSPEKRAAAINKMSDDEFAKFQNSLNQAVQLGLVKPPSGGNGG